jgi:hypothetical protein
MLEVDGIGGEVRVDDRMAPEVEVEPGQIDAVGPLVEHLRALVAEDGLDRGEDHGLPHGLDDRGPRFVEETPAGRSAGWWCGTFRYSGTTGFPKSSLPFFPALTRHWRRCFVPMRPSAGT